MLNKNLTLGDLKKAVETGDFSKFPAAPDPKCKRRGCFGRGYTGWYNKTNGLPVPCRCILKERK